MEGGKGEGAGATLQVRNDGGWIRVGGPRRCGKMVGSAYILQVK